MFLLSFESLIVNLKSYLKFRFLHNQISNDVFEENPADFQINLILLNWNKLYVDFLIIFEMTRKFT